MKNAATDVGIAVRFDVHPDFDFISFVASHCYIIAMSSLHHNAF